MAFYRQIKSQVRKQIKNVISIIAPFLPNGQYLVSENNKYLTTEDGKYIIM